MFKNIVLGLLGLFGIIGWTTLVFGTGFVFTPETNIKFVLSPNIYLGNSQLSETIIGYDSTIDIRSAKIHSLCNTQSQFIDKYESVYYFSLKYIGSACNNENIVLQHGENYIPTTAMKLNIVTYWDIFNLLTDYPTKDLKDSFTKLEASVKRNSGFQNFLSSDIGKDFSSFRNKRRYQEHSYQADIFTGILVGREKKYDIPVTGRSLSTQFSKIPNSWRPYRAAYTDGIHHGWDIDGKLGDQVVALDDGLVIRVVDGFLFSDLSRIEYGENLSAEQQVKNLDILRGNQVWIKTTKGEVVFYSHLENIYDYIREGDMIRRGTPVWTIGVSGVPEEGYDDYHLHFAVQVNPYDTSRAGTYNFADYMQWDWKFRGESFEYILKNQSEIFQ